MENDNLIQTTENYTPVPTQPLHYTNMSQKKPLPLFLGVLGLLVVVAGGAYYLGTLSNKSALPTQSKNVQPTPTTQSEAFATSQPQATPAEKQQATQKTNQSEPLEVAKAYLDAYVSQDWPAVKTLCEDSSFDSKIADNYGFTKYEIVSSKPGANDYYHVYIKFFDKTGKVFDKAPNSNNPLEVLMHKDKTGNWKAVTWYFSE